jgi:phosphoglycerate dehydrogenase-like enzyme
MKRTTILVLSDSREPQVAMLDELREPADVVAGESATAFEASASNVAILLNWSGSLSLMGEVFQMCRGLRWIHSRSAGLARTLFPELIASDITLTNGSGVFSPPLGEFALAAILYFAKDLRRMENN